MAIEKNLPYPYRLEVLEQNGFKNDVQEFYNKMIADSDVQKLLLQVDNLRKKFHLNPAQNLHMQLNVAHFYAANKLMSNGHIPLMPDKLYIHPTDDLVTASFGSMMGYEPEELVPERTKDEMKITKNLIGLHLSDPVIPAVHVSLKEVVDTPKGRKIELSEQQMDFYSFASLDSKITEIALKRLLFTLSLTDSDSPDVKPKPVVVSTPIDSELIDSLSQENRTRFRNRFILEPTPFTELHLKELATYF